MKINMPKPQTMIKVDQDREHTWETYDGRFRIRRIGSNTGRFAVGYSYEIRAIREEYPFQPDGSGKPGRRMINRLKLQWAREAINDLYAREAKEAANGQAR